MNHFGECTGVDVESELPDLVGRSVLDVLGATEAGTPALAEALRRLRADTELPGEVLAGWSSAV